MRVEFRVSGRGGTSRTAAASIAVVMAALGCADVGAYVWQTHSPTAPKSSRGLTGTGHGPPRSRRQRDPGVTHGAGRSRRSPRPVVGTGSTPAQRAPDVKAVEQAKNREARGECDDNLRRVGVVVIGRNFDRSSMKRLLDQGERKLTQSSGNFRAERATRTAKGWSASTARRLRCSAGWGASSPA